MKPIQFFRRTFASTLLLSSSVFAGDYANHEAAKQFVDKMVKEHGFERAEVQKIIGSAVKKQAILDAIARPAEKTKPWYEYRKIFLQEPRITQGVEFWRENAATLDKAAQVYGVAPEIVVAIIGVETRYGRHAGGYRVVDALSTLGFDYPPRASFFSKELEHFLLLAKEQKQDPLALMGSYAGAMGFGQFIPSSYRHYAQDFDGDGFADIWNNPKDAIGSVANYFKAHGWQQGRPVVAPARVAADHDQESLNSRSRPDQKLSQLKGLGFTPIGPGYDPTMAAVPLMFEGEQEKEYWLGFNNFYVITRYNRSHLYAMAVWQLSEEIKSAFERAQSTEVSQAVER